VREVGNELGLSAPEQERTDVVGGGRRVEVMP